MMERHALLSAWVFCALSGIARAKETTSELGVGLGVPVPLKVYGFNPSLEGSGATVHFLLHGQLFYRVEPSSLRGFGVGIRGAMAVARISADSLSLSGYDFVGGPELVAAFVLGRAGAWQLGLGAGPTFGVSGFAVDENMEERVYGFGVAGHAFVSRRLRSFLWLFVDVGVQHGFDELGDPSFFNQRLGSTTLRSFAMGSAFLLRSR